MPADLYELWEKTAVEMGQNFQNAASIASDALIQTAEAVRTSSAIVETLSLGQYDYTAKASRIEITFTNGFKISWLHRPRT